MTVLVKIDNRNCDSIGQSLVDFKKIRSTKNQECMIIGRTQDDGSVTAKWRHIRFVFTDLLNSDILGYLQR